jgi:hypothetical protein
MAFSSGPLPVTQACTAKPRAASMPSLALRTYTLLISLYTSPDMQDAPDQLDIQQPPSPSHVLEALVVLVVLKCNQLVLTLEP